MRSLRVSEIYTLGEIMAIRLFSSSGVLHLSSLILLLTSRSNDQVISIGLPRYSVFIQISLEIYLILRVFL